MQPTDVISNLSNYPNPFNGGTSTKIVYTLLENYDVIINIYDLLGDLVWSRGIEAGITPGGKAGPNEIEWDGRNGNGILVSDGIYICRIEAGGHSLTTKIGVK